MSNNPEDENKDDDFLNIYDDSNKINSDDFDDPLPLNKQANNDNPAGPPASITDKSNEDEIESLDNSILHGSKSTTGTNSNNQPDEPEVNKSDIKDKQGLSEFKVNENDIKNKHGNYLFTVGNTGSGKTALQSLLTYRLFGHPLVTCEYSSNGQDARHDKIIHDWVNSFREGKFVQRSDPGKIQEFEITLTQKKRKKIQFKFLEISGEDIIRIMPSGKVNVLGILSGLEKLLQNRKIVKKFIFCTDCTVYLDGYKGKDGYRGETKFTEDMMFNQLLKYLLNSKASGGLGLKRAKILFVATKWDMAADKYTIGEYFKKYFPQTSNILDSKRCDVLYTQFSVGKVETISNGLSKEKEKIMELNAYDIDLIINWIYSSFSGTELIGMPKIKYSLLDKIKNFLATK